MEPNLMSVSDQPSTPRAVSEEDREAAITALATYMAYQPGDTSEVEAWKEDAEGFVAALISHGWGPTKDLRDSRDQLAKALLTAMFDLHPIGGSTSRTGIGGATITTFCDIANPINVAAEELRDKVEGVLRRQLRQMEREGRNVESVELEVTE